MVEKRKSMNRWPTPQPPKTNDWRTQDRENFSYFLFVFQKYLCIFWQFFRVKTMFLIYCKCCLCVCKGLSLWDVILIPNCLLPWLYCVICWNFQQSKNSDSGRNSGQVFVPSSGKFCFRPELNFVVLVYPYPVWQVTERNACIKVFLGC